MTLSVFHRFLFIGLMLPSLQSAWAGPRQTAMVESNVPPYTLPEPLICEDGSKVASAKVWREKRRPELLRTFEREIYGRTLIGRPDALKFVIRDEKKDVFNGKATRLRIGILFEGTEAGRQMELLVYLPNKPKGRVPVFLGLNFDGNYTTTAEPDLPLPQHFAMGLHANRLKDNKPVESSRGINQHMWPHAYAIEHGYGIATAAYGEIEPDAPDRWQEGPRGLATQPGPADWGSIGAWAWGLSRALDYLETNPRVDAKKVAVFGFSRLGKTAVWASAQDERFALTISQASGAGGVALSKRLFGEDVEHLATKLGRWFAPNFAKYANNEEALPIDQHQLVALLAPRPVLILSGTTDFYSDPKGEFLGGLGADPVYRLFKTDGLATKEWPAPSKLVNSTIGYYLRPGGHDVALDDWQVMIDYADKHLK